MNRDVQYIKDRLIEIRNSAEEIRTLQDLIDRYQDRLEALGAVNITDMPRNPSPDHDKITVALAEKMKLEEELEQVLGERKNGLEQVRRILKKMRDPKERAVIRYAYLYWSPEDRWEDISFQIFHERRDYTDRLDTYLRRTYAIHQKALEHMVDIANREQRSRMDKHG